MATPLPPSVLSFPYLSFFCCHQLFIAETDNCTLCVNICWDFPGLSMTSTGDGLIQSFCVRYQYQYCNMEYLLIPIMIQYLLFSASMLQAAIAEVIVSLFTACHAKISWAFGLRYWIRQMIFVLYLIGGHMHFD